MTVTLGRNQAAPLERMRHVPPSTDPIERAHLRDETGSTPPIYRYLPGPGAADTVRRYWVPVWSIPPGAVSRQRVLQYPVCLIVVTPAYARLGGPTRGLAVTELSGRGWAFGVMLQPAAGWYLTGGDVTGLVDSHRELARAGMVDGAGLTAMVREVMAPDPHSVTAHEHAIRLAERALSALRGHTPEDDLVNRLIAWIEESPEVLRVSQVCERFGLGERALQRLTRRRVGLSPKWLIQRRRLHEAAGAMAGAAQIDLAALAADLGYSDQAHFTRDFRTVTGMTPGRFAAQPRSSTSRPRGDEPVGPHR
jgi:AraC-like DNA-binding protein